MHIKNLPLKKSQRRTRNPLSVLLFCLLTLGINLTSPPQVYATPKSPWGSATPAQATYTPQKVVFDVSVATPEAFDLILDRMSGLSVEYGADPFDASVIAVLHGPEMAFFDIRNFEAHEDLVRRAQSLTVGGVIQFRMCQRAAANQGILPEHVHGFIDMVPMGDAEIIRLQKEEEYAYMK